MKKILNKPDSFVITGGPGAGKTSLIDELRKRGFSCVDEVARQIIKEQTESGKNALPWGNIGAYTNLMLSRSVESFVEHRQRFPIVFFDRGIPDTLAYAKLTGQEMTPEMNDSAELYRYNPDVFILPAWEEIYRTDTERKQSFREAVATFEVMKEIYAACGYRLREVPEASISERADFVESIVFPITEVDEREKRLYFPLLLEADPSVEMIEKYLDRGTMYAFKEDGTVVGIMVVIGLSATAGEIKNLSVLPQYQNLGIGRRLIEFALRRYRSRFRKMYVGTSESGIGFYRQCGFEVSHVVRNFFTENYPEPIYDDGLQCVDMTYLVHDLDSKIP